jgi:hypothetical protein
MMFGLALRARLVPVILGLVLLAGACAPKTPPATVPGAPKFPDFVYPAVADAASPLAPQRHSRRRRGSCCRLAIYGPPSVASRRF